MGLLDPTERITHNLVLDTTAHAEAWAVCFLEDIVNNLTTPRGLKRSTARNSISRFMAWENRSSCCTAFSGSSRLDATDRRVGYTMSRLEGLGSAVPNDPASGAE